MTRPKVYITRKIPSYILQPYEDQFTFKMWHKSKEAVPKEVLYKESTRADSLICLLTEQMDEAFLHHANHLDVIANMAVGYDHIDIAAAEKYNIVVTNTPDVLTETTADLTFTLLLATARRLQESTNTIYRNEWDEWAPFHLVGTDVHHKTIGIVGMGRIGQAVAQRAKGFNMKILYHNRSRNLEAEKQLGATYTSFEQLLQEADFVVSLLPLTDETENMFNIDAFKQMKSSAIFINTSRGGVVNETHLYEALCNHMIHSAGLDVFKNEPISKEHPLASLKNVVLTPHIGSATKETREKMLTLCFENLVGYYYGEGPITPVKK